LNRKVTLVTYSQNMWFTGVAFICDFNFEVTELYCSYILGKLSTIAIRFSVVCRMWKVTYM